MGVFNSCVTESEKFFCVPIDERDLNYESFFREGIINQLEPIDYNSHNTDILSDNELEKKFLNQMWALKYKSTGKGTRLHADDALLNLNLWITPDSSKNSIDEDSGMVIYKKSVPEEWNFEDYNQSDTKIENYIKLSDPQKVTIPYKENRAVIFDSKFIHKSQDINFKNGYKNKRINITMLFDLIYS